MDLLKLFNAFNIMDSIDGLRGDLVAVLRQRGGGVGIPFAAADELRGGGIESILKRYKIPVWGRRVTGHMDLPTGEHWLTFSIRTEAHRADFARYIMWRAGAIVINDPNPNNATWAAKYTDLPPAWADNPHGAPSDRLGQDQAGQETPKTRRESRRGSKDGRVKRAVRDLW